MLIQVTKSLRRSITLFGQYLAYKVPRVVKKPMWTHSKPSPFSMNTMKSSKHPCFGGSYWPLPNHQPGQHWDHKFEPINEQLNNIINKSFFQLRLTNLTPHLILLHLGYKLHILINVTYVNPKAQSLLAHSNFLKITNASSYNPALNPSSYNPALNASSYNPALNASSYIFLFVATAMNL